MPPKVVSVGPSYADVVAFPKKTGMKQKVSACRAVFVKSKDNKHNVDEVKDTIKKTVRPRDLGVNIKRVVIMARGVLVETEGDDQLLKLKKCTALEQKGLIVEKPKKRSPRIIIFDVDNEEEETIVEDSFVQNMKDTNTTIDDFKKDFRCVYKYKKRDPKDITGPTV